MAIYGYRRNRNTGDYKTAALRRKAFETSQTTRVFPTGEVIAVQRGWVFWTATKFLLEMSLILLK